MMLEFQSQMARASPAVADLVLTVEEEDDDDEAATAEVDEAGAEEGREGA